MASSSSILSWWSADDVQRWLREIGFEKYCDFFLEHNMSGASLLSLRTEHLFYLAKVFDEIFIISDVLKFERYLDHLKESSQVGFSAWPIAQDDTAPRDTLPVSNEANWQKEGFEENIRAMEATYPDDCWRYKSAEVLMKDYIPSDDAPHSSSAERTGGKAFLATATHVISPVDFYIQPTLVQSTIKKMQKALEDVYSEQTTAIPRENIFVGMPCVARFKQDGNWYRAQVVDAVGTNETPVRFVDFGHRQYSPLNELKPLRADFGRIPPAALRCRIRGVRERTLEQKVLDAFHADLNSIGCEIRVEIVGTSPESLLVEIYNQCTNENIGSKYLPKEPICPKVPSLEAWKKKKERERAAKEAEAATENVTTNGGDVRVFASDMDAFMEGALDGYSSSNDGQTSEIKRMNKKLRQIKHEQMQKKCQFTKSEDQERNRIVISNDIEAVLQGMPGYDSEEESEKASSCGPKKTTKKTGFHSKPTAKISDDVDEDDKDEKASVGEFPDEKKLLVTKWLEQSSRGNGSAAPGASAAANATATAAPKRISAAAMYNPDLTRRPPIGQRSVTSQGKPESVKEITREQPAASSVSEAGGALKPANVTRTPRLPLQSSEVYQSLLPGSRPGC